MTLHKTLKGKIEIKPSGKGRYLLPDHSPKTFSKTPYLTSVENLGQSAYLRACLTSLLASKLASARVHLARFRQKAINRLLSGTELGGTDQFTLGSGIGKKPNDPTTQQRFQLVEGTAQRTTK